MSDRTVPWKHVTVALVALGLDEAEQKDVVEVSITPTTLTIYRLCRDSSDQIVIDGDEYATTTQTVEVTR